MVVITGANLLKSSKESLLEGTSTSIDKGNIGKPPGNFFILNKTHEEAKPDPRGCGPNGGPLQSHHVLQKKWAEQHLPGYDPEKAPTITIENGSKEDGSTLPHTLISTNQRNRRKARVEKGGTDNAWNSDLNDELNNAVSDLKEAGFTNQEIHQIMEPQYAMLDKLKVNYKKVEIE